MTNETTEAGRLYLGPMNVSKKIEGSGTYFMGCDDLPDIWGMVAPVEHDNTIGPIDEKMARDLRLVLRLAEVGVDPEDGKAKVLRDKFLGIVGNESQAVLLLRMEFAHMLVERGTH